MFTFLVVRVFCISGCWVMLEKGTSMENLMVCRSWMTMLETILKLGFLFPPEEDELRVITTIFISLTCQTGAADVQSVEKVRLPSV